MNTIPNTNTIIIDEPSDFGFTIYTKSNCKYCTYVKELLKSKFLLFKEIDADIYLKNEDDKARFLSFIKTIANKEYKTFPMVFNDGVFIGGYDNTKEYIDTDFLNFNDLHF